MFCNRTKKQIQEYIITAGDLYTCICRISLDLYNPYDRPKVNHHCVNNNIPNDHFPL